MIGAHDESLSFIKNVSCAVAANTAQKNVQMLDTSNVATAYRSACLLVEACDAHGKAREHMNPLVQEDRLEGFGKVQKILESELALGSYSGMPMLEQKLKETLAESSLMLSALEPTKVKELTQQNESTASFSM